MKVSTACPQLSVAVSRDRFPARESGLHDWTQSPAVGVIHLTIELAVVLAVPQNDATTIVSLSLNLTRLQKPSEMMRPAYNQHGLTCKQDNGI